MSWHYLRDQGGGFSAASSADGGPCAPSKSANTAARFCCSDNETDICQSFQSGMMCPPSTGDPGVDSWILLLVASRARTLALPAPEKESQESEAGYGRSTLGSLAKYDHASRSWKTAQRLLFGGLDEFLAIWPRWGLMRDGAVYRRPSLARRICEIESGSSPIPTPLASDYKRSHGMPGREKKPKLLSTPRAARRGTTIDRGRPGGVCRSLESDVATLGDRGPLNPDWIEWLMGWPIGWTALEPLATDRFQRWLTQHGVC